MNHLKLLVFGFALTAASAGVATAQDRGSDEPAPVEDIVVTGSKIASTDRAAVAASTLAAEDLQALNITSVREAQVRLPSIVYNDSGGAAQVYIRGIGTNSAYAGLESSVGTYVDGVYLQRQVGASLDVVDLKSIQVLNGPQGSLYGRNATGGVILVNTNDPSNRFEGRVRASIGSFETYGGEGVFNLPISETVQLRFAGSYSRSDGFIDNIANGDSLGGYERSTIRAKLRWAPTDRFEAVLGVERFDLSDDPVARRLFAGAPLCLACTVFGVSPSPAGEFHQVAQTATRNTDIDYTSATLRLQYSGDKFDLTSISGARDFNYAVYVDQDYASADLFNSSAREFGTTYTNDTFVRSRFAGPLNFIAGVSGEIDTDTLGIQVFGAAFGPLQGAGGDTRVKLQSISPYAEIYYNLTDALKLTLGGRYNVDEKRLTAVNNPGSVLALGAVPNVAQSATYREFTPRAVLSYETDNSFYYASYSRGTKSGGFNSPAFTPLLPLEPEELDSFEIGAKTRAFDQRLRLSGAAFLYDYQNIQVSFVDADTGSVRAENAASAENYGLELNASFDLTPSLSFSGGLLLQHARFKDYVSAAIFCPAAASSPGYPNCPAPAAAPGFAAGRADLTGSQMPRAPDASFFVGVSYSVPINADWTASFAANSRYSDGYDFTPGAGGPLGLSRQDAFNIVSASVTLTNLDGLEVRLFGNNLTDEEYYLEAVTSAFGAAGTAAAPRSFGLSVGYSF